MEFTLKQLKILEMSILASKSKSGFSDEESELLKKIQTKIKQIEDNTKRTERWLQNTQINSGRGGIYK